MSQPESEAYLLFPTAEGGVGLVKADSALKVVEFQPSDLVESDRKFGGWMTVEVRDRQGDIVLPEGITVEEYIKVMGGPLLDMHRNKPIGRLTKMELRPKKTKDGAEKMGVYVEGYIFKGGDRGFRDYPNWRSAWDEIKSSFRDSNPIGLSLGGDPEGTFIRCKEGSCERVVKVTYLEEVSLVRRSSRPANPESFLDKHNPLAKSDDRVQNAYTRAATHYDETAGDKWDVNESINRGHNAADVAHKRATAKKPQPALDVIQSLGKAVEGLLKAFEHEYKCGGCGTTSFVDGRLKDAINCSTCSRSIDTKAGRIGIRFRKADGSFVKIAPKKITNGSKESPTSPIAPPASAIKGDPQLAGTAVSMSPKSNHVKTSMDDEAASDSNDVTVEGDLRISRLSAAKAMARALTKIQLPTVANVRDPKTGEVKPSGQHPMYRPQPFADAPVVDTESEAEGYDVGFEGPEVTGQKPSTKRAWRARGEQFGTMPATSPRDFTNAHRRIIGALRQRLGQGGESFYQQHYAPGGAFSASGVSQRLGAANPEGYHMTSDDERQFLESNLRDFLTRDDVSPYMGQVPEGLDPVLAQMVNRSPSRLPRAIDFMLTQMPNMRGTYGAQRGQPMFSPEDIQATRQHLEDMFYGGVPREAFYAPAHEGFAGLKEHPRWDEIRDFRTALIGQPSMGEVDENTGYQRPIHYPNPQQGLLGYVRGRTRGKGQATGYAERDFTPTPFGQGEKIPLAEMARAFHGASQYARQRQAQRQEESRRRAAMAVAGRAGAPIWSGATGGAPRTPKPTAAAEAGSPEYAERLRALGLGDAEIAHIMGQSNQPGPAPQIGSAEHNQMKDLEAPDEMSNSSHAYWAGVLSGRIPYPGGSEKFPGQVYDPEADMYQPVPPDEFATGELPEMRSEEGVVPARSTPYGAPAQRLNIIMREAMRHGVAPHQMDLPAGVELPETDTQVAPIADDDAQSGQGIGEADTDRENQQIYVPGSPKAPDMKEQLLRRAQMEQRAAGPQAQAWQPKPTAAPTGHAAALALARKIREGRVRAAERGVPITGFLGRGHESVMSSVGRMTRNIPTQKPPAPTERRASAMESLKPFTEKPGALPSNAVVTPAVKKPAVPDVPKEQDQVHRAPSRPRNAPPTGSPAHAEMRAKPEARQAAERVGKILALRPKKPEGKPPTASTDGNA